MSRHAGSMVVSLVAFVIAAFLCESIVRVAGTTDADGNRFFRNRRLKPYHLPVAAVRAGIAEYHAAATSAVIYDPHLGWTPRPSGHSSNGLAHYNSAGIRTAQTPREYTPDPQPGVLRIALFGDSFTHCNDVPFEHSWGFHLEAMLAQRGVLAEVLNFGVGGYGIDQAYLRWAELGRSFRPHVVILGFQPEDVLRDVNLIRHLYVTDSGLSFSKPRFIMEREHLTLINVPTIAPDHLADVIEHIDSWHLKPYEHFYNAEDYRDYPWMKSAFVSFLAAVIDELKTRGDAAKTPYAPDMEAGALALRIIDAFKADATATGARFLIVNLPTQFNLTRLSRGGGVPYSALVQRLTETYGLVDTTAPLLQAARESSLDSLFVGHYSNRGNQIVAATVADAIAARERQPVQG